MNRQSMTYDELLKKHNGDKESISYNELLWCEEWRLKRKEILKRDSFVCQNCKKRETKTLEFDELLAILGTNNLRQNWKIVGNNRIKTEIVRSGDYWFIPETAFKKFNAYVGCKHLKTPSGWILIIAEKSYSLNVHHKKYIFNILPWENYNNDFETFCIWCHLEIHNTEEIKCYNLINDRLIPAKMTPCLRCFGKGKLPQYEHIENGICFRCLGKRFEELIEKNE